MKKIENSQYLEIFYEASNSLFAYRWKPENAHMDSQEYTSTMSHLVTLIVNNKGKRVLADMRDSQFVIVPELQEWNARNVFRYGYEHGMRVVAFVIREDLIQQLSIEQMSEEAQSQLKNIAGNELQVQFFLDKDEAYNWLCQQEA